MNLITAFIFFILLIISGCSKSSGDNPNPTTNSLSVWAADPYLYNATFYHDANRNGLWDEGEVISSASDSRGVSIFQSIIPKGEIIEQLAPGTMDGFIYWAKMRAFSNGTNTLVINPMTTLLVNGFSEEQLINLFRSAGISLEPSQLYKNPMADPNLMVATIALAQGLMATYKGFSLSPRDITGQGYSIRLANNYAQQIFNDSAKIYSHVITSEKFNLNLINLSKETSSLFDYMRRFGTDDFIEGPSVDTAKLGLAENAILEKLDDSTNALEPIVLNASGNDYSSIALKNKWFKSGSYDVLGFTFKSDVTRMAANTIGNYPNSPQRLSLNFVGAMVTKNNLGPMCYQSNRNPEFSYTFHPDDKQIALVENLPLIDGDPAINVEYSSGLPILVTSYTSKMNFKTFPVMESLRLVGSGESVRTYYGVDPETMTVDTARTNNCLVGNAPNFSVTTECSAGDVSVFYDSQKDRSTIFTDNALTHFSDRGESVTFDSFSFIYKNRKLNMPNGDIPVRYEISDLKTVPGNLVLDTRNCTVGERCLRVVGEGDTIKREGMSDSVDLQHLIAYDYYPQDYNIYALNSFKIRVAEGVKVELDVSKYSSFYKEGMIYLKLPPLNNSPVEYIVLDLFSKQGAALSKINDWIQNGQLKFRYRDIEKIEIKELMQKKIPFASHHNSAIKLNACN